MKKPAPPDSLPTYLAEGIPKQDTETLRDVQAYATALIDSREQPVQTDDLPETADPIDDPDESEKGTVVTEKVKCGDDSCKCTSENPQDMHGPYLYRYYRENGTMKSEYIGKADSSVR
jgi:hypothetical protein